MRSLMFIVAMALISQTSSAVSKAYAKRGGSCTDYCTKDGSSILKLSALDDKSHPEDVAFEYNSMCSRQDYFANRPGNVHWCASECSGKGGLKTAILNPSRKKNVSDYVTQTTRACEARENEINSRHEQMRLTMHYGNFELPNRIIDAPGKKDTNGHVQSSIDTLVKLEIPKLASDDAMEYAAAIKYCKNSNLAGKTGWRLPERDELVILSDGFSGYFNRMWALEDKEGHLYSYSSSSEIEEAKNTDKYYVFCVRDYR